MHTRPRILLAEDDPNLGALLAKYLDKEGFDVMRCTDGLTALQTFQEQAFELCLVDVMMPKLDGFSLVKKMKMTGETPVILITARSLKEDKSKGYNLGADDYVTKPFDEEELLWKIKAMIRRMPENTTQGRMPVVALGHYLFDPQQQVLELEGSTRRMTEKESELLHYLYQHRNRVIKREELLKALWGENDYFSGRSLDVFITKIRKYVKDDPQLRIENVFKVGFIFHVPGEAA